jgi:transposase
LLSCTTLPTPAAPEVACCRLAPFHRDQGARRARRYPSDTTDAQWAVLDPLLPDPAWLAGRGGRPEAHCRRQIVDAIFYLVDNGIKWRALPADYPPWSTVYNYLAGWEAAGVTQQVLDGLRDRVRLREGRTAEPTAGIIDSQSVRAAETVPSTSRVMTRARKSTDASVKSPWTRWGCCCACSSPPRPHKIVMVLARCYNGLVIPATGSDWCGLMVVTPANSWTGPRLP